MATALEGRDDKEHAFTWLGVPIATFIADDVKTAKNHDMADKYLNPTNAEDIDTSLPPGQEGYFLAEDMGFFSVSSVRYMGLTMTKYLTGTNELQSCDPSVDVHSLPGYSEHLEFWKETKALYRDGKMKQFGYDY